MNTELDRAMSGLLSCSENKASLRLFELNWSC